MADMDLRGGNQQKKMLDSLREGLVLNSRDPAVQKWKRRMGRHVECGNNRRRRRCSSLSDLNDSNFPVFSETESDQEMAPKDASKVFQPRRGRRKQRMIINTQRSIDSSDLESDDEHTDLLTSSLPDVRKQSIEALSCEISNASSSHSENSEVFESNRGNMKDTLLKMGVTLKQRPKFERARTGSGEELMLMSLPGRRKGSLTTRNVRRMSLKRGSVVALAPITEKSARANQRTPSQHSHLNLQGPTGTGAGAFLESKTPVIIEEEGTMASIPGSRKSSLTGQVSLETFTPRVISRQDTDTSQKSSTTERSETFKTPRLRRLKKSRPSTLLDINTAVTRFQTYGKKKKADKRVEAALKRMPAWKRKLPYGNKFKRLCKFFCVLYRLWKAHSIQVENILQSFESLDALIDDDDENRKLLFDVSDYKAHREARISQEAQRILKMPPRVRTEKELHYLKIALRNYSTIVEYPVHMQKLLAERAWYEGYDARRVLIREGHPPWNFYFILSGAVIVSVFDKEKNINKTVCFLNRGDSFGEVSLRNRSKRETTIISKEKIELLVISGEDFFEIFMSGGLSNPKDPFLRSIPYLKGWPLKLLGENPRKATFSFFKRGTILCRDSTKSDWLYIIKSGSCSVLKKLRHVNPDPLKKDASISGDKRKPEKKVILGHEQMLERILGSENDKLEHTSTWQKQLNQPEINISTHGSYIKTGKEDKALSSVPPKPENSESSEEIHDDKGNDLQPAVKDNGQLTSMTHRDKEVHLTSSAPFLSKPNVIPSIKVERASPDNKVEPLAAIAEEKNSSDTVTKKSAIKKKDPEEEEMFVIVQTLTKGSMFGLADLVYGHQPVFSVVSNGAEIIMVHKRFYQDHMDQFLETKLREEIFPFPTDEVLQEQLKTTVNWEFRRSHALEHTMNQIKLNHINIHDARATLRLSLTS